MGALSAKKEGEHTNVVPKKENSTVTQGSEGCVKKITCISTGNSLLRLCQGSIKVLSRLCQGSIKAL